MVAAGGGLMGCREYTCLDTASCETPAVDAGTQSDGGLPLAPEAGVQTEQHTSAPGAQTTDAQSLDEPTSSFATTTELSSEHLDVTSSGARSSGVPTTEGDGTSSPARESTQSSAAIPTTEPASTQPSTAGSETTSAEDSSSATGTDEVEISPFAQFVENPGAECSVGVLPSTGALTSDSKLPNPFVKMDGTPLSSKSEWLCRREEILQQAQEFIYGDKPVPEPDDVAGTVSGSSITVTVNGGAGGYFSATVTLPDVGLAPYPAVISFGTPSFQQELTSRGIAVINYSAYSVGSEQVAGDGAFYDVYGASYPSGLLIAWAWGVSRLIDVIVENPGTIDATKLAVSGCSRFGKGAFVAGAFDHRIALTIPMESGIGGTTALRLVEQLDSYAGAEWPYHAISYEPWFSPTRLGAFTTGNNGASDDTAKLPIDMHEIMGLVVPRGLYVVDNPKPELAALDRYSSYVTALVGQMTFQALGVGSNLTYEAATGDHCVWRTEYTAPLVANLEKFLLEDNTAVTGSIRTDMTGTRPVATDHVDWSVPVLPGEL